MTQGEFSKNGIVWENKSFEELSAEELYELLALRVEIFVVEQNCPYQELDYKDQHSYHMLCRKDGNLVAYLRMIEPGIAYETPAIGRFAVKESERRTGIGRELLRLAVKTCAELWQCEAITISGQAYLYDFYTGEGFDPVEGPYLDDGIPHYKMKKTL